MSPWTGDGTVARFPFAQDNTKKVRIHPCPLWDLNPKQVIGRKTCVLYLVSNTIFLQAPHSRDKQKQMSHNCYVMPIFLPCFVFLWVLLCYLQYTAYKHIKSSRKLSFVYKCTYGKIAICNGSWYASLILFNTLQSLAY
jgi:hypothetical protein